MTRVILIAKVVFILLVLNKCFVQIHGPLAGFDYFEIPGWLIVYVLLIGPDLMGQNQYFIPAVRSSFDVLDSVWRELSVSLSTETAKKHRHALLKSVKRIFYHFLFLKLQVITKID